MGRGKGRYFGVSGDGTCGVGCGRGSHVENFSREINDHSAWARETHSSSRGEAS